VKVTLLSYTPDALELLLMTKQTRLTMEPGLLDEIKAWPPERKQKELDYMRGTIQSSWEFVDYTFLIDEVSRAFTHQFVRTRQGSYAQQSQRTVDMSGFDYITPESFSDEESSAASQYRTTMRLIQSGYQLMIEDGVPPQDARGVLPTNIATNIVGKFSLRTLSEMAKVRLCTRTQGEYQDVFRAMRERVIEVHPWAEPFIRVHCAALGVCAFPNFMECPIKGAVFNADTGDAWDGGDARTREEIQQLWQITRYEARPAQGAPTK
jgi:flavin-dependent thymidylate synthase